MSGYYSHALAGERLARCYELAPPRVQRYLQAEMAHVAGRVPSDGSVLELGCGTGRVLERLANGPSLVVGLDTTLRSLAVAARQGHHQPGRYLLAADAVAPALAPGTFDVVCCLQNGISAFRVDPRQLLERAVGMTRAGGTVLVATYAEAFWPERLEWFRIQAAHGLIGEIDEAATGDGVIVCRDGFIATTFGADELLGLAAGLGRNRRVREVDGSSLFLEIEV